MNKSLKIQNGKTNANIESWNGFAQSSKMIWKPLHTYCVSFTCGAVADLRRAGGRSDQLSSSRSVISLRVSSSLIILACSAGLVHLGPLPRANIGAPSPAWVIGPILKPYIVAIRCSLRTTPSGIADTRLITAFASASPMAKTDLTTLGFCQVVTIVSMVAPSAFS